MPNWCSNRVRVWADDTPSMLEFKEFVMGRGENKNRFSFESILPMPEELRDVQSPVTIKTYKEIEDYKEKNKDTISMMGVGFPITQETSDRLDEAYGNNNWHDWSCDNWGVKWDCTNVEVTEEFADLELQYTFDTPWGPPAPIYDLIVAKFPDIGIQWFWDEPGCEQAGYLPFKEDR